LKSPRDTEYGLVPVGKSVFKEKVGVGSPGEVVFRNTETVVELEFATAISNFPSPLKSPVDTEIGPVPVGKSVLAENEGALAPGVAVFKNTETDAEFKLAVTISSLPSPLKSPMDTEIGLDPVVESVLAENEAGVVPIVVVFKNTDNEFEPLLATTISGLPSPLKSPIETDRGLVPVVESIFAANVGVGAPGEVVFRNTDIVLETRLAVVISGLPSALRSRMDTANVLDPVAKSVLVEKVGMLAPVVVVLINIETELEF